MDDINNIIISSVKEVILDEEEYLRKHTIHKGLFHIPENVLTEKIVNRIIDRISEHYVSDTKFHITTGQLNGRSNILFLCRESGKKTYSFIYRNKCSYFTILDDIIKLSIHKDTNNACFYFVLLDKSQNKQGEDQRISQIYSFNGFNYHKRYISVKQVSEPINICTRYNIEIQVEGTLLIFEFG